MTQPNHQAAPGELELVRAFVNSNDIEDGRDEFASPAQLRAWLSERGLIAGDAAITEAERRQVIAVREALRALLLANNGAPLPPAAVAPLQQVGQALCLRPRVEPDGQIELVPDGQGAPAALGRLLAIVYRAMLEDTWTRLKACRSDTCQWAFYDHSRNRSGAWCTMSVCGSRSKARAYRQRRRGQVESPGDA